MFDRIACFMVRIRARRHFVMSIIKSMNLISVHFWTYLSNLGPGQLASIFHVKQIGIIAKELHKREVVF